MLDTPLAESAIVGVAIGAALNGLIPIAEIQFADFIHPAFDQIVSEAARTRYRSNGDWSVPIVIRAPFGGGVHGGLYHSQSIEAFYAHVPGVKVVVLEMPLPEVTKEALDKPSGAYKRFANYTEQIRALVEGGVDLLLPETSFDTLVLKACLFAIEEYFEDAGGRLPVMISGTIFKEGLRTLSGQTVEAFYYSVAHVDALSVGVNCAVGVDLMRGSIETLSSICRTRPTQVPRAYSSRAAWSAWRKNSFQNARPPSTPLAPQAMAICTCFL